MFASASQSFEALMVDLMQSDDAYRAKLQGAIADIKAWAQTVTAVANITEEDDSFSWRLVVEPHAHGACPVELMMRVISDEALYDIRIADEGYEDRAIDDLKVFVPILEAVAAGHVIQRLWKSGITDTPLALATVVGMPGSELWRTERSLSDLSDAAGHFKADAHYADHRFLPYFCSV
jgi:hypothetical protein